MQVKTTNKFTFFFLSKAPYTSITPLLPPVSCQKSLSKKAAAGECKALWDMLVRES